VTAIEFDKDRAAEAPSPAANFPEVFFMSLTRRRFIETASLTLLASSVLPAPFAQSLAGLKNSPFKPENLSVLDGVSVETFKPFIGESFAVTQDGREICSLTLLSVTSATTAPPSTVTRVGIVPKPSSQLITSFSLRFRGSGAPLTQDTYTLDSDRLGSFPLFIVPAATGVTAPTYTATFTLLVQ
jgi:hypothetical protein